MAKSIFISLPVADVARSTAFYQAIGFERNPRFSSDQGSSMTWSDSIAIMVVDKGAYGSLTPKRIIDAHTTSGALFALSFASKAEVDAITEKAIAAGGREAHGAEDLGFMYSRAFTDPDGHSFGPMWIDAEAAATAMTPGQAS